MDYAVRLLKSINALPPSEVIKIRSPDEIGSKELPRMASAIFRAELFITLAVLAYLPLSLSLYIPAIPPFTSPLHSNPTIAVALNLLLHFGLLSVVSSNAFYVASYRQNMFNKTNKPLLRFVNQFEYRCLREVMAVYPELHSARHQVGFGRIRQVEADYIRLYDLQRHHRLPAIQKKRQEMTNGIRLL